MKYDVTILGGLNEFTVKFLGPKDSKYLFCWLSPWLELTWDNSNTNNNDCFYNFLCSAL